MFFSVGGEATDLQDPFYEGRSFSSDTSFSAKCLMLGLKPPTYLRRKGLSRSLSPLWSISCISRSS
jgi:hypothetical protein